MFKLLIKTISTVTILFISLFVRAMWRLVTCNAGAQKRKDLANKIQDLTGKMLENLDAPNVRASMVTLENKIVLHNVTAGDEDGQLVVLLHGFPENWTCWLKQIPFLAKKGYFVVAPDMRGYNLSEKPTGVSNYSSDLLTQDVANLIKYYERKSAIVVAHDWGGVIAWKFAMDYPEMVTKLIILNAPHMVKYYQILKAGWEQRLRSWYILYFQLPLAPEFGFLYDPIKSVKQMFTTYNKNVVSDAEIEYTASAWSQPNAMTSMLNYYRALLWHPTKAKPTVIQTPTLLLWGKKDTALTTELAEGLQDKWVPNITVKLVDNCSHWITHDAPKEVEQHITEFLA